MAAGEKRNIQVSIIAAYIFILTERQGTAHLSRSNSYSDSIQIDVNLKSEMQTIALD